MMENIEDIFRLTPMQEGMLFHYLLDPSSGLYVEQLSCTISSRLDPERFAAAWSEILSRHQALRSSFEWEDIDSPVQIVHKNLSLPFRVLDWSEITCEEQDKDYACLLESEVDRGFDLTAAPLMRLVLIRLSDEKFYFIWTFHHILFDGWSLQIIISEVFGLYGSLLNRTASGLNTPLPFSGYLAWLERQSMAKAESFWKKKLIGNPKPGAISPLLAKPSGRHEKYSISSYKASRQLTERIQAFSRDNGITVNTFFQCIWTMLIHCYTGSRDILFGNTVSGRPYELPGSESMVGLFINTLPVRLEVNPSESFCEWISAVQSQQIEAREYEYAPLSSIQEWCGLGKSGNMFESIIVFENYPSGDSLGGLSDQISIENVRSHEKTNYPLTLVISPQKELLLEIAFQESEFSPVHISLLFSQLMGLITQVLANPEIKLGRLTIIAETEEGDRSQPAVNTPHDNLCIHRAVENSAKANAHRPAVIKDGRIMNYSELNSRANQLAGYLKKKGLAKEDIAGICMKDSPEMIIALLAVLKAGGAYLPLDVKHPAARLNFIMKDSAIKMLITTSEIYSEASLAPETRVCCVFLDTLAGYELQQESTEDSADHEHDDLNSLAYVIYTSGSTGSPKGTLIEHKGIYNLARSAAEAWQAENTSRILRFASFGFDVSVIEIFTALCSGAAIVIPGEDELKDEKSISEMLRKHSITILPLFPALLSIMDNTALPEVSVVISGGEACSWETAGRWSEGHTFFNVYGPTETTVAACWYRMTHGIATDDQNDSKYRPHFLPIGKAIPNVNIYVLNSSLRPVPAGVKGEICISGTGLARGYLGRQDLTALKFIPDDISGLPGGRLYRTGDLGRVLDDGNIEFLGRLDEQIKIRGFRIEPGEISSALLCHPDILNSIVISEEEARQDYAEPRLVAYVIRKENPGSLTGDNALDKDLLDEFLSRSLPKYMIPEEYFFLPSFPLTANGKINTKGLSEMRSQSRHIGSSDKRGAKNAVEELLCSIWCSVLSRDGISAEDNFFDLGGHSLKAMQAVSRIRETFGVDLPLKYIFNYPRVSLLAPEIEKLRTRSEGRDLYKITHLDGRVSFRPSFSQLRLWFLNKLNPSEAEYNIPVAVKIKGKFDIDIFQESCSRIIQRHQVLRTVFRESDGYPVVYICDEMMPEIHIIKDGTRNTAPAKSAEEELIEFANRPFDLASGPLFRILVKQLSEDEFILLVVMHHIISDGWSMTVMIEELTGYYGALISGDAGFSLRPLVLQYADYAEWQNDFIDSKSYQEQMEYWRKQLSGISGTLELETDYTRTVMTDRNGLEALIKPGRQLTDRLLSFSRSENITMFMLMLSAFHTLLFRYTGQKDIITGIPVAGRRNSDLEGLIGFFVNTLVLRNDFSGNPTLRQMLQKTRQLVLEAYDNQDIPFEKLVEELSPRRDLSHNPLFQIMFVYQGFEAGSGTLPGLRVESIELRNTRLKFDMTFIVSEDKDGLEIRAEFNAGLFRKETVENMLRHFRNLLEFIISAPDARVNETVLLTDEELFRITHQWNNTVNTKYLGQTAVGCLERNAELFADAPAVVFMQDAHTPAEKLSYSELNKEAGKLASYLKSLGVRPDHPVGISLERSAGMICGIWGIIKSGCAFVPIDPVYPEERIDYILNDSGIKFLITQEKLAARFRNFSGRMILTDADFEEIHSSPDFDAIHDTDPSQLAYIIYTSGSTGVPKGVMLTHSGLCNLADAQREIFSTGPDTRVLQFSSLSFDASVWEMVMALLSGGTLYTAGYEIIMNGQSLVELIRNEAISNITLPPSVLSALPAASLPDLKTLILAGESLKPELLNKWTDTGNVFNAYGPTETTVCASVYKCSRNETAQPPIGRPIANTRIYILDAGLQPAAPGRTGQIFIAGAGLARGYLNRPELTAEKFIPDPFSTEPGQRMYSSGDTGRFLDDGNIEFLGRMDDQVKIRGFRIEPGEIESALKKCSNIRNAVAIARGNGSQNDKVIAAYIIPEEGIKPDIAALKSELREKIPEYMIPSVFIQMQSFPLNTSGKLDRNALPETGPELASVNAYVAPRSLTESRLAGIVKELLKTRGEVGVEDNFFELGGHSLLVTQFISRIKDSFGVELSVRTVFENPTVSALSVIIDSSEGAQDKENDTIQPVDRETIIYSVDELKNGNMVTQISTKNQQ